MFSALQLEQAISSVVRGTSTKQMAVGLLGSNPIKTLTSAQSPPRPARHLLFFFPFLVWFYLLAFSAPAGPRSLHTACGQLQHGRLQMCRSAPNPAMEASIRPIACNSSMDGIGVGYDIFGLFCFVIARYVGEKLSKMLQGMKQKESTRMPPRARTAEEEKKRP